MTKDNNIILQNIRILDFTWVLVDFLVGIGAEAASRLLTTAAGGGSVADNEISPKGG